ncbi:MAG: lipocalin-like domain-containing protein [Proteobacteria bacterium]|nr:lipocalin-like domain-containing protein [Pseudomonadota bacterium]
MKYLLAVIGLVVTALCSADDKRTTQQDLIGAWRLVAIDVQGPNGREPDPFYGNGSRGLLIYDASGWFSVQIEGANRPPLKVPELRPTVTGSDSKVLHTYYAYFGTWSFDPATSTVTHHAKGALYPSEDAAIYPQRVVVVGRRMTFSRAQNGKTQTKVWERVSG